IFFFFDPGTGTLQPYGILRDGQGAATDTLFGQEMLNYAENWLVDNVDSLTAWHSEAAAWANLINPFEEGTSDFFAPGTQRFEDEFKRITSAKSNLEEGGTRFYDKSALYHAQGEYKFKPTFLEHITVGGSFRLYTPKSDGTIFYDTAGIKIRNHEFGFYTGTEKTFMDDRLRLSATVRVDKNENFNWISTPAASIVFKPKANNFLRLSFSSALRNPTLSDQYLFLKVGRAILAGNLEGAEHLATIESFGDYLSSNLDVTKLAYFDIAPIQPEKVKTFEAGYRTTLFNSLYVDAGYYFNLYNDFLGYKIGLDIEFQPNSSLPKTVTAYRYAANSDERITSQGVAIGLNYYFGDYFQLAGNYNYNVLNTKTDDDIVPAFNTPKHKYNFGFSGRDIPINLGGFRVRKIGFNMNYKWVQGFLF
ncbi:MAG: hypothetical protein AAB316_16585, partial [Bacteroidota bacterium]